MSKNTGDVAEELQHTAQEKLIEDQRLKFYKANTLRLTLKPYLKKEIYLWKPEAQSCS